MFARRSFVAVAVLALAACPGPRKPGVGAPEPVAAPKPHDVTSPNGTRNDEYYWLRDDTRKDPEVIAYLEAENRYARAMMEPVRPLERTLLAEMTARIAQQDESAPVFENGWWYVAKWEPKQQYAILVRKQRKDGVEQVILDENERAKGHAFYEASGAEVSPDGRYLAWTEDTVGRRQRDLRVKDLTTGAMLPDTVHDIENDLAWANDSKTLFYVGKDKATLRSRYVTRHVLGTPASADVVVYDETDDAYYTGVSVTKSRKYIVIDLDSTLTTEARLIDASKPTEPPRVFLPRESEHEYYVDHDGERFVVRTNDHAKNFRIVEVPDTGATADRAAWRDLVPHDPDALISDVAVYKRFLAWEERRGGLQRIRVMARGAALADAFTPEADDPTFAMSLEDTPELDAASVRWSYNALTTPEITYELDLATRRRVVIDETPSPGFDRTQYVSEYVHATAPDGSQIPISIARRKDTKLDGTAPVLVYGYGAYGYSINPSFGLEGVSLLDRGWVYAIAHVRGGSEMGRPWYEHGRQLEKMNSFTDYIAACEHLVTAKYAARDKVFAVGGSAGGLLVGAAVTLRPDLFRGVLAAVPFVDVITTMLDETIPLTTNEFDEWGNPVDKRVYDYMLQYSPYDNVAKRAYPSILVTTGLWDSQVQYYEPAKWVARLRAHRTDENLLVLETDMTAGHGGKTGRFDEVGEWAHRYAFFLHVLERPDSRAARMPSP
ncbi:MAG TPA: S9 family peptidase [Kofleriaceae bacterium]|nr:S9 family peptidase [Kofleriaceae bacterium]